MKAKELRDLSGEELREKEQGLSQELFNLRFQKATGQLGNTAMLKNTRRALARVKSSVERIRLRGDC